MWLRTHRAFADRPADFDGVASRYAPILFRIALRRLRDVEDAEDAVQDALLSAQAHRPIRWPLATFLMAHENRHQFRRDEVA